MTVGSYIIQKKNDLKKVYENKSLRENDLLKYFDDFDTASTMVMDNITQLKTLVKRFKDLDPDTTVGRYSSVNMKMFFGVVLDSMNIEVKDIHITLLCDPTLTVTIDQGKLAQVIIVLIENAYIHGFSNVSEGLIVVEILKEDGYLKIEVKDNGDGISEESIKQIFEPFYSEQLSKNSNGLGLSVVYNIVTKIFKGTITCSSDLNVGTSFVVKFLTEE